HILPGWRSKGRRRRCNPAGTWNRPDPGVRQRTLSRPRRTGTARRLPRVLPAILQESRKTMARPLVRAQRMVPLLQDVSHAIRGLRRRPAFLVAALLTLGVGICANVTVFSIVDALLLRPLPFGDRSDRVVTM